MADEAGLSKASDDWNATGAGENQPDLRPYFASLRCPRRLASNFDPPFGFGLDDYCGNCRTCRNVEVVAEAYGFYLTENGPGRGASVGS